MTQAERFVLIVQTTAIVEDIHGGRTLAGAVVQQACIIAERLFPSQGLSVGKAASDLIEWNYGRGERPAWWEAWMSERLWEDSA